MSEHPKHAETSHPVHDLVARRWSPYAFDARPVAPAVLASLFEAARWAASSYNEQPWRWIVATRAEPAGFARLLSCLVEANQAWAQAASVLALGVIGRRFSRNDKPNRAAEHDLGLAAATLTFEATARGLVVHQMIGIEPARARELYAIPEGFDALTGLAIGYAADPAIADEKLAARDRAPRTRRPLAESVFGATWGEAATFVR